MKKKTKNIKQKKNINKSRYRMGLQYWSRNNRLCHNIKQCRGHSIVHHVRSTNRWSWNRRCCWSSWSLWFCCCVSQWKGNSIQYLTLPYLTFSNTIIVYSSCYLNIIFSTINDFRDSLLYTLTPRVGDFLLVLL
jgi:hypothetical protein